MLQRSRVVHLLLAFGWLAAAAINSQLANAEGSCAGHSGQHGPISAFNSDVGTWHLHSEAEFDCRHGAHVEVTATADVPGDHTGGHAGATPGHDSIYSRPIVCRLDDYMFLPPGALAGVPCIDNPSYEQFNPRPLAVRLAAEVPAPDLRIRMNPERGMVNVPTWFWVEGYDGGTIGRAETVREDHERCRFVPVRGPDGLAVLGSDGRPQTRTECQTETTMFEVAVRLWANHYGWDFGDLHSRNIACAGQADCGDALGQPYTDIFHPSPIQHPYIWSSLGVNGAQDAYTIRLAITFAAEYQVRVNGQDQGGWRGLPARTLTWTTNHQVQEAQAVLTRP